jgi:hypothetical protein
MEEMRPQRPAGAHSSATQVVRQAEKSMLGKALVVLLIVLVAGMILAGAAKAWSSYSTNAAVKSKQYQAVFLTNGQVYFGKISSVDSDYVVVKDIYYLQVQQAVQPKDAKATAEQPQVSLAKLGGELHGPDDVMYISREQVLFWENLKGEADSKVTKAIKEYQASKK